MSAIERPPLRGYDVTTNNSERPTRTVNDAVKELLASAKRQRDSWQAEIDKRAGDVKRLDAVISHLERAAAAADGEIKPPTRKGRGQWHPCARCGRPTPRAAEDGLCKACAQQPAEATG